MLYRFSYSLSITPLVIILNEYFALHCCLSKNVGYCRECVSTGAAGAQTRRSLGHHLLHRLILRLLVLHYRPLISSQKVTTR
jgi:hypothetical protein